MLTLCTSHESQPLDILFIMPSMHCSVSETHSQSPLSLLVTHKYTASCPITAPRFMTEGISSKKPSYPFNALTVSQHLLTWEKQTGPSRHGQTGYVTFAKILSELI